jgi:hypothetical protein
MFAIGAGAVSYRPLHFLLEHSMAEGLSELEAAIRRRLEQGQYEVRRADSSQAARDLERAIVPYAKLADEARRILAQHRDYVIIVGEARRHYEQAPAAKPEDVVKTSPRGHSLAPTVTVWSQLDAEDYDEGAHVTVEVFDGVDIQVLPVA